MSNAVDDYIAELERQQQEKREAEEKRQRDLKIQLDIESEEMRQRHIKHQELERQKQEEERIQRQKEERRLAEERRKYMIKHRWDYINTYHQEYKKELISIRDKHSQSPDFLKKLVDNENRKLDERVNALPIPNYNPEHTYWDVMEAVTRKYIQQKIFNKNSLQNK